MIIEFEKYNSVNAGDIMAPGKDYQLALKQFREWQTRGCVHRAPVQPREDDLPDAGVARQLEMEEAACARSLPGLTSPWLTLVLSLL